jgi:hypothetical protein
MGEWRRSPHCPNNVYTLLSRIDVFSTSTAATVETGEQTTRVVQDCSGSEQESVCVRYVTAEPEPRNHSIVYRPVTAHNQTTIPQDLHGRRGDPPAPPPARPPAVHGVHFAYTPAARCKTLPCSPNVHNRSTPMSVTVSQCNFKF